MQFYKCLDILYIEHLVRNSKNINKNSILCINYKNLIKINPLKLNQELLNLAEEIRHENSFRATQPLQNAYSFLISSNLLFDKFNSNNQADPFKLPAVVLSSFTCELFIKYWMLKSKPKEFIPFKFDTDDHVSHSNTLNWAFYTGSLSKEYIKDKKLTGNDGHLLFKLFDILPENLIKFHQILYEKYYSEDDDLEVSLEKISRYFTDGRYNHEDVNKEFDLNLCNYLANFFFDAINFIINTNPESVLFSNSN